jgi:hypothetical protein
MITAVVGTTTYIYIYIYLPVYIIDDATIEQ